MRDEGVTSGTAIIFWAHGGSREPDETIPPSYEAERQPQALIAAGNPVIAPWVAHARFAPPGPGLAYLPTIRLVLPLFDATAAYLAAPPALPEAQLDEPAVLEHIAGLVEAEESGPAATAEFGDATDLPEMADPEFLEEEIEHEGSSPGELAPESSDPAFEALPPPYWGATTDPVRNAELTDAHVTPTVTLEPAEPELLPEPPVDAVSVATPPGNGESGVLSWLDRRLRSRRKQELEQFVEPEPVFYAPETAPDEVSARDETLRDSPAEPQFLATEPPPVAPAELFDSPAVDEPARDIPAEPQPLVSEPPPHPVATPEFEEISVVEELPRESRIEPQLFTPEPPPAPAELPVVVEPSVEIPTEPQFFAPEPPPQPVPPPTPIELPVVVEPPVESQTEPRPVTPEPSPPPLAVDVPRSRRIEPRAPRRSHLPSLFTRSKEAPPSPAAIKASRSGRPGWRLWRRDPGSLPAEASVAAKITGASLFQSPAPVPLEPAAPAHDLPSPNAVEDVLHPPEDPPVPPAPEPLPAQDFPPLPAELVPDRVDVAHAAPVEPQDDPAAAPQPAAYWAKPNWVKPAQTAPDQPESLAWTPPPGNVAGSQGARRTTPAMDGLWETEVDGASDSGPAASGGTGRRAGRRAAAIGGGVIVLAAASVAVFYFLPRAFVSNLVPAATFNAPMMVLRANGTGRVVSIAVQNGQTVDPDTLLLTIRTEPQPDPAASLLRMRLEAAQSRMADLDQSIAQTTPATDAGRTRIADLRRQRASAVIDVAQLQDAVSNIPAAKSSDQPVKAGVHGVIRSLEARNGTMTAAGVPLVRMLDCDHAFLTVPPDSRLRAGEAVQVRLPNLAPVAAVVRQSTGIAEPPDSLVIATQPGAFVGQLSGSCPIGATATVTPSMTGS